MLLLLPLFVTNLQIAAAASSADSSGDDGSTSRDDPGVGADPPGAGDDGGMHLPRTCVRRGLARGGRAMVESQRPGRKEPQPV